MVLETYLQRHDNEWPVKIGEEITTLLIIKMVETMHLTTQVIDDVSIAQAPAAVEYTYTDADTDSTNNTDTTKNTIIPQLPSIKNETGSSSSVKREVTNDTSPSSAANTMSTSTCTTMSTTSAVSMRSTSPSTVSTSTTTSTVSAMSTDTTTAMSTAITSTSSTISTMSTSATSTTIRRTQSLNYESFIAKDMRDGQLVRYDSSNIYATKRIPKQQQKQHHHSQSDMRINDNDNNKTHTPRTNVTVSTDDTKLIDTNKLKRHTKNATAASVTIDSEIQSRYAKRNTRNKAVNYSELNGLDDAGTESDENDDNDNDNTTTTSGRSEWILQQQIEDYLDQYNTQRRMLTQHQQNEYMNIMTSDTAYLKRADENLAWDDLIHMIAAHSDNKQGVKEKLIAYRGMSDLHGKIQKSDEYIQYRDRLGKDVGALECYGNGLFRTYDLMILEYMFIVTAASEVRMKQSYKILCQLLMDNKLKANQAVGQASRDDTEYGNKRRSKRSSNKTSSDGINMDIMENNPSHYLTDITIAVDNSNKTVLGDYNVQITQYIMLMWIWKQLLDRKDSDENIQKLIFDKFTKPDIKAAYCRAYCNNNAILLQEKLLHLSSSKVLGCQVPVLSIQQSENGENDTDTE
jgi:hypothetical protein